MRLTKHIRQGVIDNLLAELVAPKRKQYGLEIAGLCQDAADTITQDYPDSVIKWLSDAPTGGVPLIARLSINLLDKDGKGRSYVYHTKQGRYARYDTYSLTKPIAVLRQDEYISDRDIVCSSALGKKFLKVMKKVKDLNIYEAKMTSMVTSAIQSCTTDKQLADRYEDLVKYLPAAGVSAKLPALTNSDVLKCLKGAC